MRRVLLALSLAVLACGGTDSTSPNSTSVGGVWNLRSVNGTSLPATFVEQGVSVTVTAAVLTMSGSTNGAYNEVFSYRAVSGGQTINGSNTEVGTWSANGGSITFSDQTDGGVLYQGSVSGNTLTEIVSGFTQVYSR